MTDMTFFKGPAADISPCGKYRSLLLRGDNSGRTCAFIMLNPSTADALNDDPTIRRCMGFAKRENCSRLLVANLFTGRATKPKDLWTMDDPVGPEADTALEKICDCTYHNADVIICAWGAKPKGPDWFSNMYDDRVGTTLGKIYAEGCERRIWCLGLTQAGAPRHPLYIPSNQPLIKFGREKP